MDEHPEPAGADELWLDELPDGVREVVCEEPDDRPVPALGLGDQEAAVALLAATRAVLLATEEAEVTGAVARFAVGMGGSLVPARLDCGSAIPLDIALGAEPPILVDAEALSVARMRLEQYLPMLVEDARTAVGRLRQLADAAAVRQVPSPPSPPRTPS